MKNQMNLVFRFLVILVLFLALSQHLSFAQKNLPSVTPDRIILNATPDPATSVAVTWRTDLTVNAGICELQAISATKINPSDTRSFKAKTRSFNYVYENEPEISANQHSVILTGLTAGTSYLYRVGHGDNWSEWFEFKTPGIGRGEYSFIYFGDPQLGLQSEWSRVVRKAYQFAPDCLFMLYAGDIINRAGKDIEWHEWFKAGSHIFPTVAQILTPGNHDYKSGKVAAHWNAQFTQPTNGPAGLDGTCFFVDYPNLRLISMDSAAGSELEDENGYELTVQKAWLDSVLRTNTKPWVVVTTHLPFYSTKDSRDNALLRKHFQPILEKHKVDLVLTGHDHSYGRGRASDTPGVNPSVVYVVSVSGPKLYPAGTKSWMEHRGGHLQLFQKVTVGENALSYKSYRADGSLFDEFRIERKANGEKKFNELKPSGQVKN